MEIWTSYKKLATLVFGISPTASSGKYMEIDIYDYICYFSPTTPTKGSTNRTPAVDSRKHL